MRISTSACDAARLLCLAGLLGGCATPLSGAARAAGGPISLESKAQTARLVFVRPAEVTGSNVSAVLLDPQRRRVFGKSVNDSSFAVDVEPGDYLVCGVPYFEQTKRPSTPELGAATAVSSPLSRLSVAAGRTYLLAVSVGWGPRIEAVPVRPGSAREARVVEALATTRAAEPVPESAEFRHYADEAQFARWLEFCLDSSSDDLRLRLRPEDAR